MDDSLLGIDLPVARDSRIWVVLLLAVGGLAAGALHAPGCSSGGADGSATATKVDSRRQLIGGVQALGEIGDYRLANDEVQLVVQDKGFNRGNGLFGGSLIDADLVRTNHQGNVYGGNGGDTLGEVFPAFFLEAVDPEKVRVANDGSDGEPAVVEVSGRGGEFVTMLRYLNQSIVNSYDTESLNQLPPKAAQGDLAPFDSEGRPLATFETRYVLRSDSRSVRIDSTIRNNNFETVDFPGFTEQEETLLENQLGIALGDLRVPTGQVLGFGAANKVFVPGIGYDIRWGLEEAYRQEVELPAFPGQLTNFVAAANPDGLSYGFFTERTAKDNFVCNRDCCQLGDAKARGECLETRGDDVSGDEPNLFYDGEARPDDMLFLFDAAGFAGVFTHQIPEQLAPAHCSEDQSAEAACDELLGDCETDQCEEDKQKCVDQYDQCLADREKYPSEFTYSNYFVVGDGSVSSIVEEMYRIRGRETRTVEGRIFDEQTGEPVGADVELLLYRPLPTAGSGESACEVRGSGANKETPTIFNQTYTNSEGYFDLELPPGEYCYRTRQSGRPLTEYRGFEVVDSPRFLRIGARSRARVEARVTDASGRPMPAKLSVVGNHAYRGDLERREYLYDLEAGQSWRTSDLRPDDSYDPSTRRYIEDVAYASADGDIRENVRPGRYILSFSRGPEYERETRQVTLRAGQSARVNVELEKVVDTSGHVSGDFHMHAQGSIDSGLNYTDRVISIAAEDVDVVVSSDHNYVSDFQPYIEREGLERWMTSFVGVELTTFEFGHFNGFPLDYDVGSINRGSVEWQRTPPQKIFDRIRDRGSLSPEETVIQVNHPRDSILGYFSQYSVDGFRANSKFPLNRGSDAIEKTVSTVTMPSGDSFVRDCRPDSVNCCPGDRDNCDEPRFESTYSWDFDALEIFNGKRMELNRHFRIPYGEQEWPRALAEQLLSQLCESDTDCEDGETASLVRDRCCADGYESPTDTACEEGSQSNGACPVWEKQQALLSQEYPEDAVLCDEGDVAFPGGLDDWYNMLNYSRPFVRNEPGAPQSDDEIYHRVTATGNSDSHKAGEPNLSTPGHPRNYVRVGTDDPEEVTASQLSKALRNQRNIVTNGPFVQMRVTEAGSDAESGARVGGQFQLGGGEAAIRVTIRAADWVGADRFRIVANGEPLDSLEHDGSEVEQDERGWVSFDLEDGAFERTYQVSVDRDTWFVLEVEGGNNLFPVYPPSEIPRLPFDEIIGQIAPSLGFGSGTSGLEPDEVFALRPFAFTNPIWVVRDGTDDSDGEFTPPEPEPKTCEGNVASPNALTAPRGVGESRPIDGRLDAVDSPVETKDEPKAPFPRPRGATRDVRTLFRQWGHGH
jgi:hypothetical protein